jgi:hypothetical protein
MPQNRTSTPKPILLDGEARRNLFAALNQLERELGNQSAFIEQILNSQEESENSLARQIAANNEHQCFTHFEAIYTAIRQATGQEELSNN